MDDVIIRVTNEDLVQIQELLIRNERKLKIRKNVTYRTWVKPIINIISTENNSSIIKLTGKDYILITGYIRTLENRRKYARELKRKAGMMEKPRRTHEPIIELISINPIN